MAMEGIFHSFSTSLTLVDLTVKAIIPWEGTKITEEAKQNA